MNKLQILSNWSKAINISETVAFNGNGRTTQSLPTSMDNGRTTQSLPTSMDNGRTTQSLPTSMDA